MKRKHILIAAALLFFVYSGSYIWFRQTHIEAWEKDQMEYVIFPIDKALLYYTFRPATYLDSMVTGMRFHVGPHR